MAHVTYVYIYKCILQYSFGVGVGGDLAVISVNIDVPAASQPTAGKA